MSLRDLIAEMPQEGAAEKLYAKFGFVANPFPASNQTSTNPHRPIDADNEVERRIVTFLRDSKSQVVVVQGTQGVGKTNFLNHFESEIRAVLQDIRGYYMVRYLADPEASFDGTTRRLFEELGTEHLERLANRLQKDSSPIQEARSQDMQVALRHITESRSQATFELMMHWLLGLRVLKVHRTELGVQFRLDTVESKTAALRDMIHVSAEAGVLKGIFLLLDELEKQDGVLGPTAVVRYLSAVRSIVDALPERLFLMLGVTPDALLRYSTALPALRGRLQNQITLEPLQTAQEALNLAGFYLNSARRAARYQFEEDGGTEKVITKGQARECFEKLARRTERLGDLGVRQREYLHELHDLAETAIQHATKQ